MSRPHSKILPAEWSDCLSRLRDARALVLRDAESFHEAVTVLERIGQVVSGQVRGGLNDYKGALLELALPGEKAESTEVARLFETVREARNMAVHEGAWARHLSSRLVDFFLILEQAIMKKMKCAEDIMVRQPIVAETWHMIAHVRLTMLANSFSNVPVLIDNRWHIITDLMIMRFLRGAPDGKEKKARLSSQLEASIRKGEIVPIVARCFLPETKLDDLISAMDVGPALVTDGNSSAPRLLGILTSFDLL